MTTCDICKKQMGSKEITQDNVLLSVERLLSDNYALPAFEERIDVCMGCQLRLGNLLLETYKKWRGQQ